MSARRILLMGGGGGVVGSGVLEELAPLYAIRSYHRSPVPAERGRVDFVQGDVLDTARFPDLVRGVDAIVNVVWYREPGPDRLFARTAEALHRLVVAAREASVETFVQISLPPAPPRLETRTPYLYRKRQFESELQKSGIRSVLLQPSAIFAGKDRLIHVMLELMRRHGRFPLFGDGSYHLSPVWNRDLGWYVAEALEGRLSGTVKVGGPERLTYRELLDRLVLRVPRRVRIVQVSATTGRFAVQMFNAFGWHVLYTYEYDWLLSDMLGFPAPPHPGRTLLTLDQFLDRR